MRMNRRRTRAILKIIAQGEDRSPLFWWMVEHHDEIAARVGKRIAWRGVCAMAATSGLTDTRGQPPSERNARETWRQARIAFAEAQQRQAARSPGRLTPSRIPPGWRPMPTTLPVAAASPRPRQGVALPGKAAGQSTGQAPDRPLTPEEQRNVDRANAQMDALFAEHDKKLGF